MSNKSPIAEPTKKPTTNEELHLQDKTGNSFCLKVDRVDQLFAHTELYLQKETDKAMQSIPAEKAKELAETLLSRFGLKSSQDVIQFLKSPAGKSTIAKINQDLANLAAIKDLLAFEKLQEQLRQRRVLAFLLLGLLYKREAKAHEAYAHAIEEQEKLLHSHKTPEAETSSTTSSIIDHPINLNTEAYTSAAEALENELKNTLVEADKLENEIRTNEEKLLLKEIKYKTIYEKLAKNDEFGTNKPLANLIQVDKKEVRIKAITSEIEKLTKVIKADEQRIAKLLGETDKPGEIAPMNKEQEENNEKEARKLLANSNATNIQIGALQDMLAVINGKKTLYKENGEAASTFNDADFILEKENKLVKKDDKHYILTTDQSLEAMSQDEKAEAQRKYAAINPEEMMSVKNLVKQYDNMEQKEYETTKTELSTRNKQMQEVILLLANQMAEVQAAASSELALKKAPTTSQSVPLTAAPCTSTYYRDSYKHMLTLMKSYPTHQSIDFLKDIMNRVDSSPDSERLKTELNKLKPGTPIPDTIMNRLLAIKDLGTNWLDVRKPDSIKKDFSSPVAPSTAPTPLITKPFGGG